MRLPNISNTKYNPGKNQLVTLKLMDQLELYLGKNTASKPGLLPRCTPPDHAHVWFCERGVFGLLNLLSVVGGRFNGPLSASDFTDFVPESSDGLLIMAIILCVLIP